LINTDRLLFRADAAAVCSLAAAYPCNKIRALLTVNKTKPSYSPETLKSINTANLILAVCFGFSFLSFLGTEITG
jgi:hypothetical protein